MSNFMKKYKLDRIPKTGTYGSLVYDDWCKYGVSIKHEAKIVVTTSSGLHFSSCGDIVKEDNSAYVIGPSKRECDTVFRELTEEWSSDMDPTIARLSYVTHLLNVVEEFTEDSIDEKYKKVTDSLDSRMTYALTRIGSSVKYAHVGNRILAGSVNDRHDDPLAFFVKQDGSKHATLMSHDAESFRRAKDKIETLMAIHFTAF